MLKYLHLTRLQWKGLLRWALYGLVLLACLVFETVLFGRWKPLGAKITLVPPLLVCVCVREGPEKGGLFALIGSMLWCFAGTDFGNLSVAVCTVLAVLSAVLCKAVFTDRLISSVLCCFVTVLVNGAVVFLFKVLLQGISAGGFWLVPLTAVLSTLVSPGFFYLCKAISRIGGSHGI